jgi:histone demethylase JARID1
MRARSTSPTGSGTEATPQNKASNSKTTSEANAAQNSHIPCPEFDLNSVKQFGMRHPPPRPVSRLFDLEDCPTFYPTADEFKDSMKYIQSISDQAKPYGICKIVPPENWHMPFVTNPQVC